jgi:hypothetical protein
MGKKNYGQDKELAAIFRQLEAQGWRVVLSRGCHWRCYSPDGSTIVGTGSTPGAYTAMKNFRAQLKRAGAKLD